MTSFLQIERVRENFLLKNCKSVFLVAVLLCSYFVFATDANAEVDVRFSGFATIGISSENKDDIGFIRDSNQSKDPDRDTGFEADSILGGQVSTAFGRNWRTTFQLVYRDRPKQNLEESTELAFLGYQPNANLDVRLGRMAVDMFRLSDYRRVDYINLWVRPPTEVYAWILPSSIDGIDAAYQWDYQNQFWRFKVQYGNTEPIIDFPDGSQSIDTEFNDFTVATLTMDYDVWRARISYSTATTAASEPAFVAGLEQVGALLSGPVADEANSLASIFRNASKQPVKYLQASLSHDDGIWVIDTELADINASDALVPKGLAAYISVGRRWNDWTPYIIWSQFESDQDLYQSQVDWSASGFQGLRDAAIGTINGVQIEQATHSIGARWDIAKKSAIKAQWDRTDIQRGKFAIWAHENNVSAMDQTVNVLSLTINYLF